MPQVFEAIKIDENAKIEPYVYGWMLVRRRKQREWEKKNGKRVGGGESGFTTYHSTPAQALRAYLRDSAKEDVSSIEDVANRIEQVYQKLENLINSYGPKIHQTIFNNEEGKPDATRTGKTGKTGNRKPTAKPGTGSPAKRSSVSTRSEKGSSGAKKTRK